MDLTELIIAARDALGSNLMRTGLTMLGIIIGISSVILIVSIGDGASVAINDELSSFGTNYFSINAGSFDDPSAFIGSVKTLTIDDSEEILANIDNVSAVSSLVSSSAIVTAGSEQERLTLTGVTEAFFEILRPNLVAGRVINQEDEFTNARVGVIGQEAAEELFGVGSDPIGELVRIQGRPFRIIGIIESTSRLGAQYFDRSINIPVNVAMDQVLGINHLMEVHVLVENVDFINETIEDTKVLLRDQHDIESGEDDDFTITSFDDVLSTINTVTGLVTTLVAAVGAISLVVGGIGIMNIMLVTVTERTREIGLLKALGAKDRDVLRQFMLEAVILTVSGGMIGIFLGVVGAFGIAQVAGFPFVINIPSVILAVGVSIVIGVVFGLYPARRASFLNPIDALRYE